MLLGGRLVPGKRPLWVWLVQASTITAEPSHTLGIDLAARFLRVLWGELKWVHFQCVLCDRTVLSARCAGEPSVLEFWPLDRVHPRGWDGKAAVW